MLLIATVQELPTRFRYRLGLYRKTRLCVICPYQTKGYLRRRNSFKDVQAHRIAEHS